MHLRAFVGDEGTEDDDEVACLGFGLGEGDLASCLVVFASRASLIVHEGAALLGEIVDDRALLAHLLLGRLELAEEVEDERGGTLARGCGGSGGALSPSTGFPAARVARGGGRGRGRFGGLQAREQRGDVTNHHSLTHALGPHERGRSDLAVAPMRSKLVEGCRHLRRERGSERSGQHLRKNQQPTTFASLARRR